MLDAVLATLLAAKPVARRSDTRGYTPAERWIVQLDDGRSVFVKAAVNELTADWLRAEHRLYEAVQAPFLPRRLAWEDGDRPILVLEDLSAAAWPPPWTDERIASVVKTLQQVAATPPPSWLPPARTPRLVEPGWNAVVEDPRPMLSTGIVDERWLEHALPILVEASDSFRVDGDELLHLDVRSDNVCFRGDGSVVLVDWNLAAIGNARLDVAFWLPSLVAEGGPMPETVLPDSPLEAAFVSGFFAARAGRPPIPGLPRIRPIQFEQLRHALPWACRQLGLPMPSI